MELQQNLFGENKKVFSCASCMWEGINPIVKKFVDFEGFEMDIEVCPKCNFACWEIERAKEMGGVYSIFKKKYGEKN